MRERNRVEWVDIAKLLGMFAIYIGHFGIYAGRARSDWQGWGFS